MLKTLKLQMKRWLRKPLVIASASLELGLYDSRNGKTIKAYKTAEATHLCNDSKRCIIKYANCVRGKIAQICDWYEPTRDLGTTVHYHINEMTVNQLASDEVFAIRCKIMKADPYILAKFIYDSQF
jgi:hypothetical protein